MKTFTCSSVITEIQEEGRLDSNQFPSLLPRLARAYTEIYLRIVQENPYYYRTTSTISTVAGTAAYNLPSALISLRRVEVPSSSGFAGPVALRKTLVSDLSTISNPVRPDLCRYYVTGTQLFLDPAPNSAVTATLYYVPEPNVLDDVSDTFTGPHNLDSYLIYAVLMKCHASVRINGVSWAELRNEQLALLLSTVRSLDRSESLSFQEGAAPTLADQFRRLRGGGY
ncbi:MAG: hypothetical protein E6R03_17610 [Hyphomicrobiaceae bacterium]|nr:MAG: hypothetical protein E6R03_17610 [Hyphomicrobiaceae bacterium]